MSTCVTYVNVLEGVNDLPVFFRDLTAFLSDLSQVFDVQHDGDEPESLRFESFREPLTVDIQRFLEDQETGIVLELVFSEPDNDHNGIARVSAELIIEEFVEINEAISVEELVLLAAMCHQVNFVNLLNNGWLVEAVREGYSSSEAADRFEKVYTLALKRELSINDSQFSEKLFNLLGIKTFSDEIAEHFDVVPNPEEAQQIVRSRAQGPEEKLLETFLAFMEEHQ